MRRRAIAPDLKRRLKMNSTYEQSLTEKQPITSRWRAAALLRKGLLLVLASLFLSASARADVVTYWLDVVS
jgi:hypothetical protein